MCGYFLIILVNVCVGMMAMKGCAADCRLGLWYLLDVLSELDLVRVSA